MCQGSEGTCRQGAVTHVYREREGGGRAGEISPRFTLRIPSLSSLFSLNRREQREQKWRKNAEIEGRQRKREIPAMSQTGLDMQLKK